MKVTFLGTGTSGGVPMIACPCMVCNSTDPKDKRLRSSIMVQDHNKTLVVDTGPDFRQQMLREHVTTLDGILVTHAHVDHVGGLDDIRAFNFFMNRDMNVYLSELSETILRKHFDYVFEKEPYPGIPRVRLNRIDSRPFEVEGFEVLPIKVLHHKMPVEGYRIGNLVYITDANYIAPEEKEKIKGCGVLVVNALRKEKHISHFTLDEALQLVDELQPDVAYFTHISHQLGLHSEVSQQLPPNVHLAYDGLVLDL